MKIVRQTLCAHSYPPAGFCIYCGASSEDVQLTREHIYPAGLGGRLILPQASCHGCAAVTGKLERQLLRGPLWSARSRAGIHSGRRKREQPEVFEFSYRRQEQRWQRKLQRRDNPGVFIVRLYEWPNAMPYPASVEADHLARTVVATNLSGEDIMQSLNAGFVPNSQIEFPVVERLSLALCATKVAYSFAVAELLPLRISSALPEIIIGQDHKRCADFFGNDPVTWECARGTLSLQTFETGRGLAVVVTMNLLGLLQPFICLVGYMEKA